MYEYLLLLMKILDFNFVLIGVPDLRSCNERGRFLCNTNLTAQASRSFLSRLKSRKESITPVRRERP